jgi:hypothetical protein
VATTVTSKARDLFRDGDLDWVAHTIKCVLLSSTYTFSTAHDYLDDVTTTARLTTVTLTTTTVSGGYADASDATTSAVTAGHTITQLMIYRDTGLETSSPIICHINTKSDGSALAQATDGGTVTVRWPNTGNYIFRV